MKQARNKIILFTAALLLSLPVWSGDGDEAKLRIVFAGDIMGHDSQIAASLIDSTGKYNYRDCFLPLQDYLSGADIAIGNLEVTLAGPPYKGYPRFSSPDTLVDALLESGFQILVNANNHVLDRGKDGFVRTQKVLGEKGMMMTGSFISAEERQISYPLLMEKNGILIALLNYTYGTNGLKVDSPLVVNYIDTLQIAEDLHKVKLANPDFVIACTHWGMEYQRVENPEQRMLADFMFSNGVAAIIGSHPHVVQPVKFELKDSVYSRLVVYSLGNFISNQRDQYRDGGILFGLELSKSDKTRISRVDHLPVWVRKPLLGEKHVFRLVPAGLSDEEIESMGFTDTDLEKYRQFCEDTATHLSNVPIMQK